MGKKHASQYANFGSLPYNGFIWNYIINKLGRAHKSMKNYAKLYST